MCEEKVNTVESLSKAIEEQRLQLELNLIKKLNGIIEQGSGKSAGNEHVSGNDKPRKWSWRKSIRTVSVFAFVLIASGVYVELIYSVVNNLIDFPSGSKLDNNVCVLISLALILSTVALVFLVRRIIESHHKFVESCMKEESDGQNKKKEDKSLNEKMAEKVQTAVLEMVVKDTIDSFRKKC